MRTCREGSSPSSWRRKAGRAQVRSEKATEWRQALPESDESVYPPVRKLLKAACLQQGLGQLQDMLIA